MSSAAAVEFNHIAGSSLRAKHYTSVRQSFCSWIRGSLGYEPFIYAVDMFGIYGKTSAFTTGLPDGALVVKRKKWSNKSECQSLTNSCRYRPETDVDV